MNWQQLPLGQVTPSRWRNGGGVTRALLAWPAAQDWSVRLSIADVDADGPFSAFPGIERWFAVLEGEGVRLRMADATHTCTVDGAPLRFDGGAAVHCTLVDGATRDFNLMAPPGCASMRRVRGSVALSPPAGTLLAVYGHADGLRIDGAGGTVTVPAATLAWCIVDASQPIRIEARDALLVEVLP